MCSGGSSCIYVYVWKKSISRIKQRCNHGKSAVQRVDVTLIECQVSCVLVRNLAHPDVSTIH